MFGFLPFVFFHNDVYSDVRISNELNKAVWAHGVKGVQRRLRVRLSRKRNEDEDAKEKVRFTYICNILYVNLHTNAIQWDLFRIY